MSGVHPTWSRSFKERAQLSGTPALATYLLHLIALKKSNLCLSADVESSSELLKLAEETGDSICLLKTHADIISDWSDSTARKLKSIAKKKRFLVFEDRKFGDIGSTVQKQYTSGPLSIAKWAEIVNAHIFPGPAIVTALEQAAQVAIATYNSSVSTEITVGSPAQDSAQSDEEPVPVNPAALGFASPSSSSPSSDMTAFQQHWQHDRADDDTLNEPPREARKASIVSITTTISARTEPISPQPTPGLESPSDDGDEDSAAKSIPYLRGLLLLAEMSSEGNLLTGQYTRKCVDIARQHREFVIGFIAQNNLNSEPEDNFLTMTPGVRLPPTGSSESEKGDSLGQQYNSPRQIVFEQGADVIIVGRGIISADDPGAEAERYRAEAWKAYEDRIAGTRER